MSGGDEEYPAGKPMRPLFAYVPQGNMVLSGTIRDTLTMVCPEADDEELWRAAEISCAKEFLEQLPKGLDTEIGEMCIRDSAERDCHIHAGSNSVCYADFYGAGCLGELFYFKAGISPSGSYQRDGLRYQ